MLHLLRVQAEQITDGRSRRQRAGRAGGVKNLVVRTAEKFTDANADFVTGDRCGEQLLSAGTD